MKIFRELWKHFFRQYFSSEMVSGDDGITMTVTQILAFLTVPGMFWSLYLLPKYVDLSFRPERVRDLLIGRELISDKCLLITVSMVVIAFVVVLEWDSLFPDRIDYLVLAQQPVSMVLTFAAKATALLAFVGLFLLAVNFFPNLIFPLVVLKRDQPFFLVVRIMISHSTTVILASSTVFFGLLAVQGFLMNLVPTSWFRRISRYLQFTVICAMVSAFLMVPKVSKSLPQWRADQSPWLDWLPNVWFYALWETALGNGDEQLHWLAVKALLCALGTFVAALAAYALCYKLHVKRTLEASSETGSPASRFKQPIETWLSRVLLKDPMERATYFFTMQSLARSGRQRLLLTSAFGFAFAVVLQLLVTIVSRSGYEPLWTPNAALFSVPLIFSYMALMLSRVLFTMPTEIRANWVFRLSAETNVEGNLSGVRKALLSIGLIPILVGAAILWGVLWPWDVALKACFYFTMLTLVVVEALLFGFHKVPFTCNYFPGNYNFAFVGVAFFFGFLVYCYSFAFLGYSLMNSLAALATFGIICCLLLWWLRRESLKMIREGGGLLFEETMEAAVLTLDLTQPGPWKQRITFEDGPNADPNPG